MKNLVFMESEFDDYTVDEYGIWSQICDQCVKDGYILNCFLDMGEGGGTCGIVGCTNEADHYVDFIFYKENEE